MSSALPRRSARIPVQSFAAKLASPPTPIPMWWEFLPRKMVEPCDYKAPSYSHCEVTVVATYKDGKQMTLQGAIPLVYTERLQFHIREIYHPDNDCIHVAITSAKLVRPSTNSVKMIVN